MNKVFLFTGAGILIGALIGLSLAIGLNSIEKVGPLCWLFSFCGGFSCFLIGVLATQRDVRKKKYGKDWKNGTSLIAIATAICLVRILVAIGKSILAQQ